MHIFVLEGKMLRSLIVRNLFITGTQLRGNLTAFLFKHFFSQSYHLPADMLNSTCRKNSVTISMQINILESTVILRQRVHYQGKMYLLRSGKV